jgi:hypothetical protein
MRIFDEKNVEILEENVDFDLGYLEEDKMFVQHHDAVAAVDEVYHYETIAEYPNGGKDVKKVIDVEAVEAKEAWDEYEDILRYIAYTEEEIAEREAAEKEAAEKQARLDALVNNGATWDEIAKAYFEGVQGA